MHDAADGARELAAGLERLAADELFGEIDRQLQRFTPFRVLRGERYELCHTNTLAWLLDPRGSHKLGDTFLNFFLHAILPAGKVPGTDLVEIHSELVLTRDDGLLKDEDAGDAPADRRDRLDILIEGRDARMSPWAIAIEAKIGSQEGDAQLLRYDRALARRYPGVALEKFYLTLEATAPVSSGAWLPVFWYEHVGGALAATLAARTDIDAQVRIFLVEYQQLIRDLSGKNDTLADALEQLANRADVAPVLRALNDGLRQPAAVRVWDAAPWTRCYREHRAAFDACRLAVRDAGSVLLWDMMGAYLADGDKWLRLPGKGRALTLRFVPRSWETIEGMRSADGNWNLFYHAEFRRVQRDVEIKLYVAPPGDPEMQRALLRRLFGPSLALRPADLLEPSAGYLEVFVNGNGKTVKLFTQAVGWSEQQDGTLAVGDQVHRAFAAFDAAVALHARALRDCQDAPRPSGMAPGSAAP
jgi:hypothetical protein